MLTTFAALFSEHSVSRRGKLGNRDQGPLNNSDMEAHAARMALIRRELDLLLAQVRDAGAVRGLVPTPARD